MVFEASADGTGCCAAEKIGNTSNDKAQKNLVFMLGRIVANVEARRQEERKDNAEMLRTRRVAEKKRTKKDLPQREQR